MTLNWRIYYGDGSTFDMRDGSPFDAPALNVQVLAIYTYHDNQGLMFRFDFYWYEESENMWYGGDQFGMFDYLTRSGKKKVIFGRTISTELFNSIKALAGKEKFQLGPQGV